MDRQDNEGASNEKYTFQGGDSNRIGDQMTGHAEAGLQQPTRGPAEADESGAKKSNVHGLEEKSTLFDASQYAFFGGDVSTEVELGGLGDEDDGGLEPTDDLYDEGDLGEGDLTRDGVPHGSTTTPTVDELASSFAKLGDSPWDQPLAVGEGTAKTEPPGSFAPSAIKHDMWANPPSNTAPLPGSLDSIRQWWEQPVPPQSATHPPARTQQLEPTLAQLSHGTAPPASGPLPAGQAMPQQGQQSLPQQQQWWEDMNRAEYSQQTPLTWQLQQYEQQQQQQQQQQQHSRAASVGQSGGQRVPYTLSLEELEASLALQASRGDLSYGAEPAGLSNGAPLTGPASARLGSLPSSLAAQFPGLQPSLGGLSSQPQHGYGSAAYAPPAQYLPPPLPGQQGQWSSGTSAGLSSASLMPQQAQPRAPYLPPQLLQPFQRGGGQSQGSNQALYAGGQGSSLEAFELMDAQQRYDVQRTSRGPNYAGSLGQGRQQQQLPPGMRSKYMTAEELEAIVRIQWAATHASEPYTDDYYHQAMQAKHVVATGTPHGRRHFAPSSIREAAAHARSTAERQHAFLPVEGLGRVPLSSIRRPRPLLEVDSPHGLGSERTEGSLQRPLEQEPMLAARIAIEDGMCLLLDVDDIDRLLLVAHTQSPETVAHLRRRRQLLLEGLAASLQLSDPLAPGSGVAHLHDAAGRSANGRAGGPRDDLVFLRLVSLPKGRKLLARYLRLLPPGSELQRVVVMAVFRHLRFLFGGIQSDPGTSGGLANAVAQAVGGLALPGLTACLAAVAVAPEQPPLRSIGSGGDGATLVLRALLDRATAARNQAGVAPQQQGAWQAAFDVFFGRLSKTLCFDSILNSLPLLAQTAQAVSKEMPLELLRAALPHTSQAQREQVGALLQGLLHTA